MASTIPIAPPDREQRERALDPLRSVLVRAPAGSGKTDLLTRRFLKLLSLVDDPSQVVAITFTRAAAAEMRHRIVAELEKVALHRGTRHFNDDFSMEALADAALRRSRALGWGLLELPAQLQISTIDSFCRDLALQEPLLSDIGGGLQVAEQPLQQYRRAARYTLQHLRDAAPSPRIAELQRATEALLLWRDNNWGDLEDQLVSMLQSRDQWMHGFVLDHEPDWNELRARLERPFARTVAAAVARVAQILASLPHACDEALKLARFACAQKNLHRDLAELTEFPCGPYEGSDEIDSAQRAYSCLAEMLLTKEGAFRARITATEGFPSASRAENDRMKALLAVMRAVPDLGSALRAIRELPAAHYEEAEWEIVRACFTLLRHAVAELKVIFAESGTVDFVEVAQLAQHVLRDPDGTPSDAAIAVADKIRHLLIDEFQDTSRRQHALVASLVAAWPDADERSVFVVGDPMQSIYGFRDADAELFPRVQNVGLDLPHGGQLALDPVELSANFRTAPELVKRLNQELEKVFAQNDGSNVPFSAARAMRPIATVSRERMHLHLTFVAQTPRSRDAKSAEIQEECIRLRREAQATQVEEIVALIRGHEEAMQRAREHGGKYRIAVLGRTRTALAPIAAALRAASIPFRGVDLEALAERAEVRDALALIRAFLMPQDRVAWLGVLRAPWCGLSLEDLHRLTSGDEDAVRQRPIPALLEERGPLLSVPGQRGVERVRRAWEEFRQLRARSITATPGTLMEQAWRRIGGDACVDATGISNLQLLWASLDRLPSGEGGLLSGELDSAIGQLMAQSDPKADSECGVQLMTIHKSKGLEFEVVIVPELQATQRRSEVRMLSWMERGLAEPAEDGEITEFLVAPLGPKGGQRGSVKKWVDDALRTRETQEARRILYVAATRAREELHLFARPYYKAEDNGRLELCDPGGSLLATAWPALEDVVRDRFDAWQRGANDATLSSVAAVGELIQMPRPKTATILRRLPLDFKPAVIPNLGGREPNSSGLGRAPLYRRHEGGIESRALGTAVHFLLEKAAQLRVQMGAEESRAALRVFGQKAAANARSLGLDPAQAETVAGEAMEIVRRACGDSVGAWILHPHGDAANEAAWTGELDRTVRTVRADRVFRAGDAPGTPGADTWWVIDYKTAHPGGNAAQVVAELRPLFAPQLEMYARFLRKLRGDNIAVRLGLYYPRLSAFDWWQP